MDKKAKLLGRTEFREGVLERCRGLCVFCPEPATEAHHIIERRLWPDGGYYLDNGAGVCNEHHRRCEETVISVEEVRQACGITSTLVPPHLYPDQAYDKWGNPVLAGGRRIKGELFNDESVQKILKQGGVLGSFTHWVKYPRTYHLPWSEGVGEKDRVLADTEHFKGQLVIVTEKMDGENTSMYQDYFHARSVDGRSGPGQSRVKQLWGEIRGDIPAGWRICGENLYAKHSIWYQNLSTYFMGFSVWNEKNTCLAWDETREWLGLWGLKSVPVLYEGIYDEKAIKKLWQEKQRETHEGYVVRVADAFAYGEFRKKTGKFVRKNHVTETAHWRAGQRVVPNVLAGS